MVAGTVELVEYLDTTTNDAIPEKLQGPRTVTHKNTTGFYLNRTPKDGKRGSFCGWPKSNDITYDGDTFIITERYPDDMMDKGGQIYQRRTYRVLAF